MVIAASLLIGNKTSSVWAAGSGTWGLNLGELLLCAPGPAPAWCPLLVPAAQEAHGLTVPYGGPAASFHNPILAHSYLCRTEAVLESIRSNVAKLKLSVL